MSFDSTSATQTQRGVKDQISRPVRAALEKISSSDLEGELRGLRRDTSVPSKHVAMSTMRLRSLARVAEKVRLGQSIVSAVCAENIGLTTFYRLLWDWNREGVTGLIPEYSKCGRTFEPIGGEALAGWNVAEADVLAASIAGAFHARRVVALKKIKGGSEKKESAVRAMLRAMEIEKGPLAWGISTMALRKGIHSPADMLRAKGCPLALRMNLKSQTGSYTWKFMVRMAEKIKSAGLF